MKKMDFFIRRRDAINIIKLCYILILVVSLFALKFQIFPEGEYQLMARITLYDMFIENIVWSAIISSILSFAIFKSF